MSNIHADYIKQGNCLELIKELPDDSVDLVITDPPYILDTSGGGMYSLESKGYSKSTSYINELNDIKDGFSEKVLDELCRVMKKINIYLFCSQKQIIPLLEYFVTKRNCNYNILTWHKTNPIPACGNKYLSDTEYILFFREKGVKIYGEFNTKFTYYVTPLNQKDKKLYGHPTVKPLEIIKNLLINSSQEGQIVLDPFMGSGSTCVAAINTNRHYIGYELKDKYFEIAKERLTGVKVQSELISNGTIIPQQYKSQSLWE